mgnify:CR=1 FL=1
MNLNGDFKLIRDSLNNEKPIVISVAAAGDREVIRTVKAAGDAGLAEAILVGDREDIKKLLNEEDVSFTVSIEHETDEEAACRKAVGLVKTGEAGLLMKGLVYSSIFLRAVLQGEKETGSEVFLSHLAAFQIAGFNRLLFCSDGGMNIAPGLAEKVRIIANGVEGLHRLGIAVPKVAVLAANEKVDSKVPASVDAAAIAEMWKEGQFSDCLLEGPVAMDVALSKEAAFHKNINSRIAGETDFFIVPDIQAGNMMGKALIYCAGAKMAGLILGAEYPVVMTSRAENAEGKLNSVALAAAIAKGEKNGI